MGIITEIDNHINHPQHRLHLSRPSVPFICNGCRKLGFGICYECRTCSFHLHKECAFPSTPTYHRFFQGCEFNFCQESRVGRRVCDACGRDIEGFVFQCSNSNTHGLHPQCSKLPDTLSDGKGVILELKKKKDKSECLKCHCTGRKGWFYVSNRGKYCFHVACIEEVIYEAWETSYFDQQNDPNAATITGNLSSLQVALPGTSGEIVEYKKERGIKGLKSKIVLILQVIISAILGEPITAIAGLVVALVQLI